ncbi:hypothetical protein J437_LFUL013608 [Ladona fulva]|uniref:C2H2-type domain-containing protein n=1 Tax=Ladona fulva TaxID=123851 RepID=A0A8K0P5B3_LADFU|nr:hypothetical protein J437_LFUL013608 [Ladona fulva]
MGGSSTGGGVVEAVPAAFPHRLRKSSKPSCACNRCGRHYHARRSLWRHLKYECGVTPQFPCRLCGRRYKQKNSGPSSPSSRLHPCHRCGRPYKTRSTLNRHLRYECGGAGRRFECPICLKRISRPDTFRQHALIHRSEAGTALSGEWLASGGGTGGGWYAADGVGVDAGTPHSQRVKGRYVCDGCGKAYAWVSNLTRHVRLECGKEPQFQCPQCHKRTKHLSNLRVHMRTRHPEVDPFLALANMQSGLNR